MNIDTSITTMYMLHNAPQHNNYDCSDRCCTVLFVFFVECNGDLGDHLISYVRTL